jgi:DMSO reductase family type II enzyme heme b subunit
MLLVCGSASLAETALAEGDSDNDLVVRGEALYQKQCAICHGEKGDGQGTFAYLMNPRPRNFLTGKFKLTTTENLVPTNGDLLKTIRRGMPGSAMPPWDHLSQADLTALVRYIRSINTEGVKTEVAQSIEEGLYDEQTGQEILVRRTQPGTAIRIPPEPAFDNLAWFNGRKIYLQGCASCHGVDGHPVPEAVKFDDDGYPDPPRSFVNGIFKGGMESHQLYARIFKGMRGTPMPAYEGNFSDREMWDLIHYVQSLARKGSQQRAELKREVIVAARVDALPESPTDEAWNQARSVYVGLSPLWWTDARIEGLTVEALHDEQDLAIRLSWLDPTFNDSAIRHDDFRDAVAIQFSLSSDPPFYMGNPGKNGGVNMWLWKADRQSDIAEGYRDVDAAFPDRAVDMYGEQTYTSVDRPQGEEWPRGKIGEHNRGFITAWAAGNLVANPELETPVESLIARGPGTLAGLPFALQKVRGQAVYDNGVWSVQMDRELTVGSDEAGSGERPFRSGDYIPVSFAIWNGNARDRDGKKNISIWQRLVIE